jgi:uncharacterized protein YndB with AHSA1/START domain
MKIVKRILIGAAVLVAVLLIVGLFVGTDFAVEREVIINKPKDDVFQYVRYLRNHDNFSKWATMDPKMKKDYRGTDGTVGFVSAWESENQDVGKGEQEIKKITQGERIDVEIRMRSPFQSTDPAYMTTESVGANQTRVKSGYLGKMNYPTNLLCPFIAEKIGKDMQAGLTNLKTVLEKQ